MNKNSWKYFMAFLAIILFVFRSLVVNIHTNLIDWYDYPYYVWIVSQNVEKISALNFTNYFDTNAFYPHQNTLLFSDSLLPQGLLATLYSFFNPNPIVYFNLTFLTTIALNLISAFLFWNLIFKNEKVALLGSLLTAFSPFFYLQFSHFQMLSFWPFFLSLYFLIKSEESNSKYLIFSGLFLLVQFLASVYLVVFLVFATLTYLVTQHLSQKSHSNILRTLVLLFGIPALFGFKFIQGYLDVKKVFGITRDYGEFVTYSAHFTDYLFSNPIRSLLHDSSLLSRWNSFNKHFVGENASFPGFLLSFGALFGAFVLKIRGKNISINFVKNINNYFFAVLAIVGFTFSLGPRLNVNGYFAEIPLPYHFFVKYLPVFDQVRATSRWSFLFYLGITYFALIAFKKLSQRKILFFSLVLLIIVEYVPMNITTHAEEIKPGNELIRLCENGNQVLLEIPVTHFDAGENIAEGLNYISKIMLKSSYHDCRIVNGYSGYDLPHLLQLQNELVESISRNDESFFDITDKFEIDYIALTPEGLTKDDYNFLKNFLLSSENNKRVRTITDDLYQILRQ